MTQRNLNLLLALILLTDALIIGALVSVTASPAIGIPIGLLSVLFPLFILRIVAFSLGRVGLLARLNKEHPLRENAFPTDGSAKISSMSVGSKSVRLNNCVAIASDDECLHVRVSVPTVRNAPGTSIPWEQVDSITRSGRTAEVRLFDGGRLWIPWNYAAQESALRDQIALSADLAPQ